MNNVPLVSIITPTYNNAHYLEDLIESVAAQSYQNIEHIIIDDGSDDNGATIQILKKYSHLRWWSRPNVGQYSTMNEGLLNAKGEIICFVSADDILTPNAVSSAVKHFAQDPSFDGVYGKIRYILDKNTSYPVTPVINHGPLWLYPYFRFLSHDSFFIKKDYLLKNELAFSSELRFTGDYDWFIRMIKTGITLSYHPEVFAMVRIHPEQSSKMHLKLIQEEHQKIFSAHKINTFVFWVVDKFIIYRGASLRLINEFKTQDFNAAFRLFVRFLRGRIPGSLKDKN